VSLAAFLAELRRRDIQVWSDGGALRCSAPDGVLTPELRDGLRLRKPELLEFLRAAQADDTTLRAVVPLQKGGPLPPVFALPGHNGDVFCYRALVQALGKDRPFYGLQPPGVDGASAPLMSVQELAAYFAPQVRALQSKAPFIIAGFCAGGTVAFELAQQLAADGAAVEFVALFGTPHPVFFGLASQLRVQPSRRMHQVAQHLRAMATGNWKYLAQKWRNKARETTRPEAVVQFRHRVERATLVAVRRYRPKPFPGDLKLFVPSPSWARANLALRWQSMAKRTEVYYGLEGHTNDTMLLAPQAAFYAALFRDACAQPSKAGAPTERRQAPMRAVRLDGLPGRHPVEALTR
jgi:thioesterase domain-containing protein